MKRIHRDKELITKIINEHFKEKSSYDYLAKKYKISRNTISQWVYKHKNQNWSFERKIHKANYSELEYLRLENKILKKFFSFSKQKKYKINFINVYKTKYPIKLLCKILNVNRLL